MVGPTTGLVKGAAGGARGVLGALARRARPHGGQPGSLHGVGAKYHDMARDYIDLGDRVTQRAGGLYDEVYDAAERRYNTLFGMPARDTSKIDLLAGFGRMPEGRDDDLYRIAGATAAGSAALAPLFWSKAANPNDIGWAVSKEDGGFAPDDLTLSHTNNDRMVAELERLTPEEKAALAHMQSLMPEARRARPPGYSPAFQVLKDYMNTGTPRYAYMNKEDPTWSDGDRNRR